MGKEHIKCSLINERKVIIYGLFKESIQNINGENR
jgi:hypothetical protein